MISQPIDEVIAAQHENPNKGEQAKHGYKRPEPHGAFSGATAALDQPSENPERGVENDRQHRENHEDSQQNLGDRIPGGNAFQCIAETTLDEATSLVRRQQHEAWNRVR